MGVFSDRIEREKKFIKRADKLADDVLAGLKDDEKLKSLGVSFAKKNERSVLTGIKGLRAFWITQGGYIESSTVHEQGFEVPWDLVGVHVQEFEDKLVDAEAGWERLGTLVQEAIVAAIVDRVVAVKEAAGGSEYPSEQEFRFVVWTENAWGSAYLEDDNRFFHLMISIPAGGVYMKDTSFGEP